MSQGQSPEQKSERLRIQSPDNRVFLPFHTRQVPTRSQNQAARQLLMSHLWIPSLLITLSASIRNTPGQALAATRLPVLAVFSKPMARREKWHRLKGKEWRSIEIGCLLELRVKRQRNCESGLPHEDGDQGSAATHLVGNARGSTAWGSGGLLPRADPRLWVCGWAGETFLCL